jgi:hypothetical protein
MANIKNLKPTNQFAIYILSILIGLFVAGIVLILSLQPLFDKNSYDSSVESTSVNDNCSGIGSDEVSCKPIYSFVYNKQELACVVDQSQNFGPNSDQMNVYFDSQDPTRCVTDVELSKLSSPLLYLSVVVGLAFSAIGVLGIIAKVKRTKLEEYLKIHGKLIKSLPSVAISNGKYIGGTELKYPYVNYTDSKGSVLKLRCTHRVDTPNLPDGTPIDLYIDESNPTKYYTEFSIVDFSQPPVQPTTPTTNA